MMFETATLIGKFLVAYVTRSEKRLMGVYKETLKRQERFLQDCRNPFVRGVKLSEMIHELIEMIHLSEKQEEPFAYQGVYLFTGLCIKKKLQGNLYAEVWLKDRKLWLYSITRDENDVVETMLPYRLENSCGIPREEIYYALKEFV